MITKEELMAVCFGGKPDFFDKRIDEILRAINIIRTEFGKPMVPSCFYRTVEWDKKKGRSGKSAHCELKAVDFRDGTGELAAWCKNNLSALAKAGLYLEDPQSTKGWCHLDLRVRKNRVFKP